MTVKTHKLWIVLILLGIVAAQLAQAKKKKKSDDATTEAPDEDDDDDDDDDDDATTKKPKKGKKKKGDDDDDDVGSMNKTGKVKAVNVNAELDAKDILKELRGDNSSFAADLHGFASLPGENAYTMPSAPANALAKGNPARVTQGELHYMFSDIANATPASATKSLNATEVNVPPAPITAGAVPDDVDALLAQANGALGEGNETTSAPAAADTSAVKSNKGGAAGSSLWLLTLLVIPVAVVAIIVVFLMRKPDSPNFEEQSRRPAPAAHVIEKVDSEIAIDQPDEIDRRDDY